MYNVRFFAVFTVGLKVTQDEDTRYLLLDGASLRLARICLDERLYCGDYDFSRFDHVSIFAGCVDDDGSIVTGSSVLISSEALNDQTD